MRLGLAGARRATRMTGNMAAWHPLCNIKTKSAHHNKPKSRAAASFVKRKKAIKRIQ
jgi:hypothetical protein